jgi:hypothetical protein
MKVYPAPGERRVRDKVTLAIVTDEGKEVADNDLYWLTRLAHGDVTLEAPQPSVPALASDSTEASA